MAPFSGTNKYFCHYLPYLQNNGQSGAFWPILFHNLYPQTHWMDMEACLGFARLIPMPAALPSSSDYCNLFTVLAQWSTSWQIAGGRSMEDEIGDRDREGEWEIMLIGKSSRQRLEIWRERVEGETEIEVERVGAVCLISLRGRRAVRDR